MTPLRVVSPYRPFAPESASHLRLGPFDWVGALRMLQASVERQGYAFAAITDPETALPVPTIHLRTTATRLMLWILDVSLCYLDSDAFDADTVMLSPDSLVLGDLRPYFGADLTLLVRSGTKYQTRPVLNAAQWWPLAAKDRLIAFYRAVVARAATLPENLVRWGADTEAIRGLVEPIALGVHRRQGLQVRMIEARSVMQTSSQTQSDAAIVDFKYLAKQSMAAYFETVLVGAR